MSRRFWLSVLVSLCGFGMARGATTGYSGLFSSGVKDIPELLEAHRTNGLKVTGIYTGMNRSDAKPGSDSGLPWRSF